MLTTEERERIVGWPAGASRHGGIVRLHAARARRRPPFAATLGLLAAVGLLGSARGDTPAASSASPAAGSAAPTASVAPEAGPAPVDVTTLCPNPGPQPAKPACQRYVSQKVVRGGKVQAVQAPVLACVSDPGWAAVERWEVAAAAQQACKTGLCSGTPTWEVCRTRPPSTVVCDGGKQQTLLCSNVKPPWREGTGDMVRLQGGPFAATYQSLGRGSEGISKSSVALAPYWIDSRPVTTTEYDRCVSAGGCDAVHSSIVIHHPEADDPMLGAAFAQATKYCRWAGKKRLPMLEELSHAIERGQISLPNGLIERGYDRDIGVWTRTLTTDSEATSTLAYHGNKKRVPTMLYYTKRRSEGGYYDTNEALEFHEVFRCVM